MTNPTSTDSSPALNSAEQIMHTLAEVYAEARAWRIADQAARDCIENIGVKGSGIDEYLIAQGEIVNDEYLSDCIAHLHWRGLALCHEVDDDTVSVQLHGGM